MQTTNYSKQQQAVVLKGIATQLLDMAVPTFEELDKMLFSFTDITKGTIVIKRETFYKLIRACIFAGHDANLFTQCMNGVSEALAEDILDFCNVATNNYEDCVKKIVKLIK